MNILYTLNDKFVPQVSAGITSLCENNKSAKNIDFYLISQGICAENKKKLKKMVKEKYHRKIFYIEINDLSKYFEFEFDTNGWNPIVLARLLMEKLLPKTLDKIIYLDGDTIVRGNIEKLWNTKMGDKAIAASIEPTIDKKRKNALGLKNMPYYNAGVLLVDLKNWRKGNIEEKILKFYKKNNGKLFANDQDAINGALKGNIITLSPTYNFYNIFYQYSYKFLNKLCDFEYIDKNTYIDAFNDPKIVHYLGEERPWRDGNTHKYRNDYRKYLNMTYWKNEPDEKGWKLYFFFWRLFNYVTKPFPLLRYKIINSLIPVFMKIRKKNIKRRK